MNAGYYVVAATRRVFADRTILWRAAVLSALQLIPVLGVLVVGGYEMLVMRDAAWSVDRGLPRFSERREILRRGVDAFVIYLVWTLPLVVVFVGATIGWSLWMASSGASGSASPQIPWWSTLVLTLPLSALMIVVNVALVRAAVYLQNSAGLSVSGVRNLIGMNRDNFRHVAWLPVALAIVGLVLTLPETVVMKNTELSQVVVLGLTNLSSFVVGLVQVPLALVVATAYGIWAGETDPSTWPPLGAHPATAAVDQLQVVSGEVQS